MGNRACEETEDQTRGAQFLFCKKNLLNHSHSLSLLFPVKTALEYMLTVTTSIIV